MISIDIKVNNLNINYLKMGEGKTVLILPGWGTTIDVYKNMMVNFRKNDIYN